MQTLKSKNNNTLAAMIAIIALATFWNGFIAQFAFSIFKAPEGAIRIVIGVFLIPFFLAGIALVLLAIIIPLYGFGKSKLFSECTLNIDKNKVHPGDTIQATYLQTIKRDLVMESIVAELVYYEWQHSRNRKNLVKKEHVIDSVEEKNVNLFRGQQIIKEYSFTIPENAKTSYSSEKKVDAWRIKIKFNPYRNKFGLGFTETFEFEVTST